MTLRLVREPSIDGVTHGKLYINGAFECFSLEDQIRERPGISVVVWKVPSETAIPAGTYRVEITKSARFHRLLPQVMDVPGFSGVRIHSGNAISNTEGCLLVGRTRAKGWVGDSRTAFERLYQRLALADDAITITIENPPTFDPEVRAA